MRESHSGHSSIGLFRMQSLPNTTTCITQRIQLYIRCRPSKPAATALGSHTWNSRFGKRFRIACIGFALTCRHSKGSVLCPWCNGKLYTLPFYPWHTRQQRSALAS